MTQHSSTPRTHAHNQADLNFERVIDAASRLRAVMVPWSDPTMLRRCWCLREIQIAIAGGKAIDVVLRPQEDALFRPTVRANFVSVFSTMVALTDSEQAQATRAEDAERILGEIRDSIGFDELNMRVLALLHSWLRGVAGEPALSDAAARAAAREAIARHASFRAIHGGGTVERLEGGVLAIGGAEGAIDGGTDAARYLAPLEEEEGNEQHGGGDEIATGSGGIIGIGVGGVDAPAKAQCPSGSVYGDYSYMCTQSDIGANMSKSVPVDARGRRPANSRVDVVACGFKQEACAAEEAPGGRVAEAA